MRWTPNKVLGAVSDATIGTAIVMLRVVLAERERERARRAAEKLKRPRL
jgi:hypothetical protein